MLAFPMEAIVGLWKLKQQGLLFVNKAEALTYLAAIANWMILTAAGSFTGERGAQVFTADEGDAIRQLADCCDVPIERGAIGDGELLKKLLPYFLKLLELLMA